MPARKPMKNYRVSQSELYAVCKLGWASYAENVADFAAFKSFYDAAYGAAALAAVHAAQKMPDYQARGGPAESLGIALRRKGKEAMLKWKSLRAYIKSAYRGAYAKPQVEAAGYGYFDAARRWDWEHLELLLSAGAKFLASHGEELTANGGMPAGFVAVYNGVWGEWSALYGKFKDAQQDGKEGTQAKINANNSIYKMLMDMFADARIIYNKNPGKRKRFVFSSVKGLVTPAEGNAV